MSLDSEDFTIDLRRLRLLREVERRGTSPRRPPPCT